PDYLQLARA
uniref:Extended FMRFamide-2 n=1 Tax=Austrophasma gansbaaiense TaxID=253136 RepID=FAR2_AUSGA|nr:RecName: Full=Extended FMRFamide-2; Short=FMRFa-2 [Austrophasma gansbaaiense]